MHEIKAPQINNNDDDFLVLEWLVAEGDLVNPGDEILLVETSKTTSTVEADAQGYIRRLVQEEATVTKGEVIAVLAATREAVVPDAAPPVQSDAAADGKPVPEGGVEASMASAKAADKPATDSVLFSRSAREYIEARGIDVDALDLKGTITREDLIAALRGDSAPPQNTAPRALRGKRISRAKALEIELLSAGQAGGINSSLTIQFHSAALRRRLGEAGAPSGFLLAWIITALARQVRAAPAFNAYYRDASIYTRDEIHIGVAMDMGKGLLTPVIRNADRKNALETHREIADYSLKYIDSTLTEEEIFGSTITVTDLSGDNVLHFQPLINKEQACILGIGADRHQGGHPMTLTLVFDHRVLAGKAVSGFLNGLKERIFRLDQGCFDASGPVNPPVEATTAAGDIPAPAREHKILECFAGVLGLEAQQVDRELEISSVLPASADIVRVTAALVKAFPETPSTLLFECRLISDVVRYLSPAENPNPPRAVPRTLADAAHTGAGAAAEGVAIVGIAGRYPGCGDVEAFWSAVRDGRDLTTDIPADRWDITASYQASGEGGKSYCHKGGFLDDIHRFEANFFGISPKESKYMDPQQRLFLQVVWSLLENAGYTPASLSRRTGVYVGVIAADYAIHTGNAAETGVSAYRASDYYQIPNRVSHFFDLCGPSLAIDTACSSSGTGIHLACEAIRSGEVEAAIAGGVNLFLHPSRFIQYSQMQMISPGNVCRPFSEAADGTLFGEGVGAVLLKPLATAQADGDHIWGVIKATAVNAGGKTNGFTVPNPAAQAEMIARALQRANIGAETISYVEAHGTGTRLGDPIEIRGLTSAFVDNGNRRNVQLAAGSCAVGSVKSNIGHLESAAAISGLTKILLQLRDGLIAPTLGGGPDNGLLELEKSPFRIQRTLGDWAAGGYPRRACLSSFGAGGVNSHLIVEEYGARSRPQAPAAPPAERVPVVISSTTEAKVNHYAARLQETIRAQARGLPPEAAAVHLRRVAYTLFAGRVGMKCRRLLWADSLATLLRGLEEIAGGSFPRPALSEAEALATESWLAGEDAALSGYFEQPQLKVALPGYVFSGPEYRLPQTSAPHSGLSRPGAGSRAASAEEEPGGARAPGIKRYREIWTPADLKADPGASGVRDEPVLIVAEDRLRNTTEGASTEPDTVRVVHFDATLFDSLDTPNAWQAYWREIIEGCAPASDGALRLVYCYRNSPGEYPEGNAETALMRAVTPLFHLLAALKDWVARHPVHVLYAGDWAQNPFGPAFSGFARTLCIENPHYRIRNIDLGAAAPEDALLPLFASEFSHLQAGFAEIRYANGQRYQRRIVAASSQQASEFAVSFKPEGTYVITGGGGQLGFLVAADIAGTPGIKLALLGSSEPDERKQSLLRDLRERGARAEYLRADCASRASLQEALAQVRARFGAITGVIHCAGTLQDRYFTQKTQQEFLRVVRGKILGAIHLDQLTREDRPELFLSFSSTSAFGNAGQADYAYANRFLDAFCDWRVQRDASRGGASISINWPYWRAGGMRIGREDVAELRDQYGFEPLETGAGLAALQEILRTPDQGRIVLYGFPDRFEKQIERWNHCDGEGISGPGGAHRDSDGQAPAPAADSAGLLAFTEAKVSRIVCEIAEIDPALFSATEALEHYGFDSIMVNQFNGRIEALVGATSKTLMYEASDVRGLAQRLYELKTPALRDLYLAETGRQPAAGLHPLPGGPEAPAARGPGGADIAIVGIAGRYPGAPTLERFWENLNEGREAISEIPAHRWDFQPYYDADPAAAKNGKIYCKWGGFIEGAYDFDPLFFNISPAEAEVLDPQERLFLETCWTALDDAGYAHRHTRTADRELGNDVGVYVGVTTNDHQLLWSEARRQNNFQAPQSHPWSIANRVSYYFNFTGPSIACDTACSASLTAIHYACESLRQGEVRMALAGGVNLYLHPAKYIEMCQMGMLSPTGRCHTFGEAADGFVPGEGVGSVVLKSLADAADAGDAIYAVIKATAINHGGKVNGFTVPNPNAQKSLILAALAKAGIDPRSIGYVEAHGTGTRLGDPIEIAALAGAYQREGREPGYCAIGSVKSNIGHLESAAGIAGLTKLVLQLHHKTLVPSLNAAQANSNIDFASTPFRVQKTRAPWPLPDARYGDKRRAALSSFGAGGNNAHLIVEEYVPAQEQRALNGRGMFSCANPFERQTYRLVEPQTNASRFDDIQHVEGAFHLRKTLDPDSFVFSDHRINGAGALPGVFSLDLVLQANREVALFEGNILLKNVVWVNPITVADNQLLLRLTPGSGRGFTFDIVSGAGGETLHTRGMIEPDPNPGNEGFAVQETGRALAGKHRDVEELYRRMREFGVLHGPRFQVIRDILCDGRRLLSRYRLPPSLLASFGEFIAHPSIFDGAMQAIITLVKKSAVEAGATPYLFFELRELTLLKPIAESGYLYEELVSHGEGDSHIHKFNALFADESGAVCARLRGAAIKSMPAREPAAPALDLRKVWVESPLAIPPPRERPPAGSLLLFDRDDALQKQWRGRVIRVMPGREFSPRGDDCFVLDFTRREHHRRLLEALNAAGVALAYGIYHESHPEPEAALTAWGLTQFAAAYVESDCAGPLNFLYLFQSGTGVGAAHSSGMKSLLKNLSLETTRIHFKSLEVVCDAHAVGRPLAQTALQALEDELRVPPDREHHLRWDNARRYTERWCRAAPSAPAQAARAEPGRENVYLVTGGLGGLGQLVVEELLRRPDTRVIVTGRRAAEQREVEQRFPDGRGRVRYFRCDMGAAEQVRELGQTLRETCGGLSAIYHAAGVIRDARFSVKTRADFLAVLAPKVGGTLNLGELAGRTACARVILFSSTAAVLGAPGQSDYAYANGFMDGYAAHMNAAAAAGAPRWISIGWPLWEAGGMRPDDAVLRGMQHQYGQRPLATREGLEYLRQYETCPESQVLLLIGDSRKYSKYLALETHSETPAAGRLRPTLQRHEDANVKTAEFYTQAIQTFLTAAIGRIIKLAPEKISVAKELGAYGLDSLKLTELANRVNQWLDSDLMPSHFYEFTTVEAVSLHLWQAYEENVRRVVATEPGAAAGAPAAGPDLVETPTGPGPAEAGTNARDIAIIGMAGRFPGADTLDEFWANFRDGNNLVGRIPRQRWQWEDYEGDPAQGNFSDGQWGGFIRDIDCFDAAFFDISPREARYMDPQQRILIELVWQAVEDSARKVGALAGSDTSVFVGVANADYKELLKVQADAVDAHMSTGVMSLSIIANRISYLLGARGRSESIDTACSSSLVCIDRAIGTLLSGESGLAIAAGVNALLSPTPYISFSKAGLLSRTGACKTFDASADGYARAEGAGVLVLKTLAAAQRDGDPIHAVIKGSAVNHGGHANTLTSPNTLAQAEVIVAAHKRAGGDPRTIGYIEAHGTGTSLGDPVEIDGLKRAFKTLFEEWDNHGGTRIDSGEKNQPIGIGSIKANIGHLETAAGVAGVIKAVLSMKHRCLTGNIHLKQQNPYISLADTPLRLLTQAQPWEGPAGPDGDPLPLRAGVSSFGFGGTNAHVVLEEYRVRPRPAAAANRERLIALSAKSQPSLRAMADALRVRLEREQAALDLDDLEHTLLFARDEYPHRLAIVADSAADLRIKLDNYLRGGLLPKAGFAATVNVEAPPRTRHAGVTAGGRENPLTLAKLWVEGGEIDWKAAIPANGAGRIHAPGYVFEKNSHWYRDFQAQETPRERVTDGRRPADTGPAGIKLKVVNARRELMHPVADAEQSAAGRSQPEPSPLADKAGSAAPANRVSREFIGTKVLDTLADILLCDRQQIPEAGTFRQLGLDSVLTTELCGILSGLFGFKLKATEIYDHHNFAKLVDYIERRQPAAAEPAPNPAPRNAADAPAEIAAAPAPQADAKAIKAEVVHMVAAVLYMEPADVGHRAAFSELGLDSILLVELAKNLSGRFGRTIKAVDLYDNANVEALSRFIARTPAGPDAALPSAALAAASAGPAAGERKVPADTGNPGAADRRIAVVGISCRFPGADNPRQFWDNLHRGVDSIREVDPERWDARRFYSADESLPDRINCKWGGFLDDVKLFDPKFFDIPYIEAKMMDPQQRIFLEQCWNALEDAGYTREDLNRMNCGVNAGVIQNDYRAYFYGSAHDISHSLGMTGNSNAILAARISYWLNLKGPAVTLDTACSSSLVAIDMASNALVLGEVDMMLAGGVTLYLNEIPYLGMSNAGMLSADGKCKVFDNAADGFVPAEGAAVAVLKRLARAEADGDHIYGVIRASGINQDGRTNGITAPSSESQCDLMRRVQQKAGVDPASISYVEAHGTGTILGDPIEVEALKQAFAGAGGKQHYCALGSVKSNIGHTSAAAGMAGLIKILLAFQRETIPATLHYREQNRHLDLEDSPFFINVKNRAWKADVRNRRLAALSSFGFSGTNCHLVLEDYPARGRAPATGPQLFTLSAQSEAALRNRAVQLRDCLAASGQALSPAAVACTLLRGREHYAFRLAIVAPDLAGLAAILTEFLEHRENSAYFYNRGEVCPATLKMSLTDYGNGVLRGLSATPAVSARNETTLKILAELYTNDIPLDWKHFYNRIDCGVVPLPTYPFERIECWLEPAPAAGVSRQPERAEPAVAPPETVRVQLRKNVSPILLKRAVFRHAAANSPDTADAGNGSGTGRKKLKLRQKTEPAVRAVRAAPTSPPRGQVSGAAEWSGVIKRILAEMLMVSGASIDPDMPFQEMGVDSIIGVEFVKELNRAFHAGIATASLYKYPCVSRLAAFLARERAPAGGPQKPDPAAADTGAQVTRFLRSALAELLLVSGDGVAADTPFAELGLDSIIGVEFIKLINRHYGVKIKSSSLYQHPDLESFSRYLEGVLKNNSRAPATDDAAGPRHQAGIETFVSGLTGEELNRELNRQLETLVN